jgi:hypothetical protein
LITDHAALPHHQVQVIPLKLMMIGPPLEQRIAQSYGAPSHLRDLNLRLSDMDRSRMHFMA